MGLVIFVGPVIVAVLWYNWRYQKLRKILGGEDFPPDSRQRDPVQLKRAVTRDGLLVLLGILAYWILLSVVF